MTGLIGFSSGYYAMRDCNVLLMLGTDFPPIANSIPRDRACASRRSIFGQRYIGRRAAADFGLVGDVRSTIAASLPQHHQKQNGSHLAQAREHYKQARKALDHLAVGTPSKQLIHPQEIVKAISEHATKDAVFTCDVGLPTVWAARYLAMNGKRWLFGSYLHGSMANAMPMPTLITAEMPKGFSLCMVKAIMNGRTDEIVDLAKTNLWR